MPEAAVVALSDDQALVLGAQSAADRYAFATRLIEPAEALSPEAANEADADELAGIVVVDALTSNSDRKPEHVLAQPVGLGTWHVWAIDHGHTFTTSNTLTTFDHSAPMTPPMPLLDRGLERTRVERWVEAAKSIERTEARAMVQGLPGAWVLEPDAPDLLADALMARITNLQAVLSPHLR